MPDYLVVYWNPAKDQVGGYEAVKGSNADTTFTAADGDDACGLACLASGKQGKFVAFDKTGAVPNNVTSEVIADVSSTTF